MIPVTQVWDRISYMLSCDAILIYRITAVVWCYHITAVVWCHTDISHRTDTSHNTYISSLDIIYSHYNNTPSWHHIPSCWYHVMMIYCMVSYHTILIFQLLIQYHHTFIYIIYIYIYRSHGNNLRYQNWYYVETKLGAIELKVFQMVTEFRV